MKMKKKTITAIALLAAVLSGGAVSAQALPVDVAEKKDMEAMWNPGNAASMEKYNQRLAEYRKDRAAYEADPGEWTTEIPLMPARQEVPETVARQEQARNNGQ